MLKRRTAEYRWRPPGNQASRHQQFGHVLAGQDVHYGAQLRAPLTKVLQPGLQIHQSVICDVAHTRGPHFTLEQKLRPINVHFVCINGICAHLANLRGFLSSDERGR
eukprot:6793060-Alexandrium_andersonii.AAC.1